MFTDSKSTKFCPLLSSANNRVPCDPSCAWANNYESKGMLSERIISETECLIKAIAENFPLKGKFQDD